MYCYCHVVSLCSILQAKFDLNFRSYSTDDGRRVYAVSASPQSMIISMRASYACVGYH